MFDYSFMCKIFHLCMFKVGRAIFHLKLHIAHHTVQILISIFFYFIEEPHFHHFLVI